MEEARVAAAENYAPAAMYTYREAGWLIVELKNGKFAYTNAYVTDPGARTGATISPEWVSSWDGVKSVAEGWHTHWDKNEVFSGQDGFWVSTNRKIPFHVINYKGHVRQLKFRNIRSYKKGTTYIMPGTIDGKKLDMTVNIKYR